MTAWEEIPLKSLVALAENQTRIIQQWLDMTPENRLKPGRSKDSVSANVSMSVTIPIAANFIRELHRRGIETGWGWLVEEVDAVNKEKEANGKSA